MEPTGAAGAIAVANAPVSYGAFEVTVGHDPKVPDGLSVLDQVAKAKVRGHRPGPAGYLGRPRCSASGWPSAGSAWPGPTWNCRTPTRTPSRQPCPTWTRCPGHLRRGPRCLPGPPPRPTLADAGTEARRARPGRSVTDPSAGLDADAWKRFAAGLARVIARCRTVAARADVPPRDRHERRGALGDRAGP